MTIFYIKVLIMIFTASTMLSIGMAASGGEIMEVLKNKGLVLRVLLANLVIVPGIAFILVKLVPLSLDTKAGILFLAVAPGGLASLQFTARFKKNAAYTAAILFLLSIASVTVTPLLVKLVVGITFNYLRIFFVLISVVMLPLLVGCAIRSKLPKQAEAIEKVMVVLSNVTFILSIIFTMSYKKGAMASIGWNGVGVMLALIIASMITGWLLGGPDEDKRHIMATATGVRNIPLCLPIAVFSLAHTKIDVTMVAFAALMIPPNGLLTLFRIIKKKIKAKRGLGGK